MNPFQLARNVAPVIALLFVVGCSTDKPATTTERAKEEATEAARAVEREAAEARAAIARRLDKLDSDVDSLEARAGKTKGKAKAEMEKQAREMKAEARRLRDRMSTWDDKAESAWRATKREMEEGLDKTEIALKKMVDEIKN